MRPPLCQKIVPEPPEGGRLPGPGQHLLWQLSLLLLLASHVFSVPVLAASHTMLKRVTAITEEDHMHILFRFDQLPEYSVEKTGKRIDILFSNTAFAKQFAKLPEDGHLIRMVTKEQKGKSVCALYFRYPPQSVISKKDSGASSLMLDILLGNPFSSQYPEFASKLNGISLLHRNEIDYTNPLRLSRYADDWKSFFRDYETRITLNPPLRFTLPPFPLARWLPPPVKLHQWLPATVMALATSHQWNQARQQVVQALTTADSDDSRNRLLLTACDIMVREGDYAKPFALLQKIRLKNRDSQLALYAHLLLLGLQADREDPFYSFNELQQLDRKLGTAPGIRAGFTLLLAETALVSGRVQEADAILHRDNVAYDKALRPIWLLRQADVRYANGKIIQALVAYLEVAGRDPVLEYHPRSLAWFADTLYQNQKYGEAVQRYQQLSKLIKQGPDKGLALFRLARSQQHVGVGEKKIRTLLQEIQDAFPDTEAAYRARMRLADMAYLSGNRDTARIIGTYHQLARQASSVTLREEAAFKEALTLALAGDDLTSVDQCMALLRNFRNGRLGVEVRALLLQRLPPLIHRLVGDKQFIKALVLAKQNRSFFVRGWLDTDILSDLAQAYVALGAFDRAAQTYAYLLTLTKGKKREQVYLPLLETLFQDRQFDLVEDYGDRFFYQYPHSDQRPRVFLLRLRALHQQGQLEQAAQLLAAADHPRSAAIARTSAAIYFDLGHWQEVITSLTQSLDTPIITGPEQILQLAEAYFQSGQLDKAIPLFTRLADNDEPAYRDQALFRLAQIDLQRQNHDQAIRRLRQLADKGGSPLWKRLAREELEVLRLPIGKQTASLKEK